MAMVIQATMKALFGDCYPARAALRSLRFHPRFQLEWICSIPRPLGIPSLPLSWAEPGNQHTAGTQCMLSGCVPDLIPDRLLSEPHRYKKGKATLSSSSCCYTSGGSVK